MQEEGLPPHSPPPAPGPADGPDAPAVDEANRENFFSSRVDRHFGQRVPLQSVERTRISLSLSQDWQWNS